MDAPASKANPQLSVSKETTSKPTTHSSSPPNPSNELPGPRTLRPGQLTYRRTYRNSPTQEEILESCQSKLSGKPSSCSVPSTTSTVDIFWYVGLTRLQAYAQQFTGWVPLEEFALFLEHLQSIDFSDYYVRLSALHLYKGLSRVAPYQIPPTTFPLPSIDDVRFAYFEAFVHLNNLILAPNLNKLLHALNYNETQEFPTYAEALLEYTDAVAAIEANLSSISGLSCVVDQTEFELLFGLVWTLIV